MRKRVITTQQNEPVCFFMRNFVFSLQFDVFPIFLLRTAIFSFFSRKAAKGGGVSQPGGGLEGEKGKNCSSKQKNWKNIKLKWENKIKHEKTDWRVLLQVITQVFSINRNRYGALSILVTSISTIYKLCYWFDVELDNTVVVVIHDSLQPKRNRHASCSLHYPFLPLCLHSIYTRCNVHWRGHRDPWVKD